MKDELKYVGNNKQLFNVREVVLSEGRSNNSKVIEVNNSSGLYFEVNVDRGFDIPFLRYNGINFGYISPHDNPSSKYFDDKGIGFLKNFTAGFLTTCGLKSVGTPSTYDGKDYGLHGNYSNIPASHYYYDFLQDENGEYVELNSTVLDAGIFDDKLKLQRKIKCYYKSNKLIIDDVVTNESFNKAIHTILYHMNIGYPLLSSESKMYLNSDEIISRTQRSKDLIDLYKEIEEPMDEYEEACYYHKLKRNKDNQAVVGVFNPKLNMGVAIKFNCDTLDHFVEWKLMKKRDYVLGLEPCNNLIDGIADLDSKNMIKYLEPLESVKYHIEVEVIDNFDSYEEIFNN